MIDPSSASGVYAITNHLNGRVYIGQTLVTFEKRWGEHRSKLSLGRHNNVDLQWDWFSIGSSAFDFSIVQAFQPRLGRKLRMPLIELERSIVQSTSFNLYNAPRVRYRIAQWVIDELEPYRLV